MKLSELESKLRVKFPKKWHEIYDTGAMEWLEISIEEFQKDRERYINDPKAFCCLAVNVSLCCLTKYRNIWTSLKNGSHGAPRTTEPY